MGGSWIAGVDEAAAPEDEASILGAAAAPAELEPCREMLSLTPPSAQELDVALVVEMRLLPSTISGPSLSPTVANGSEEGAPVGVGGAAPAAEEFVLPPSLSPRLAGLRSSLVTERSGSVRTDSIGKARRSSLAGSIFTRNLCLPSLDERALIPIFNLSWPCPRTTIACVSPSNSVSEGGARTGSPFS
eukprot:scaffold59087_cov26-Tisochrysis_lutea.AAC.3